MTSEQVWVEGIPRGEPRHRMTRTGRIYSPENKKRADGTMNVAQWKAAIAAAFHLAGLPLMEGPVAVEIRFHEPRPKGHLKKDGSVKNGSPALPMAKPDIDNLAKAVLDAMTRAEVWKDDCQVCRLAVSRSYAGTCGAWITVSSISP